jgi:hypothetical protein
MKNLILVLLLFLCGCQNMMLTTMVMVANKVEGSHTDFNDGGTLYWYTDNTFEDALKKDKYILLEMGRKT